MAKKQAGKDKTTSAAVKPETEASVKDKSTVSKGSRSLKTSEKFSWPFSRKNLIWFLASVVVILIGYVFLSQGPYDSASSMTIGPILLVIGYLILLPISIAIRDKVKDA